MIPHRASAPQILLSALGLVLFNACGGSTGPSLPEYRRQDFPPIKEPLLNVPFELEPGAAVLIDFDVPERGDLFATIDWTDPANNVVAAFSSRRCEDVNVALAERCPDAQVSNRASMCRAKPRNLTLLLNGPAPVRLFVANTGASFESGRVQIVLCKDAPGCGAAGACAQCLFQAFDFQSCPP